MVSQQLMESSNTENSLQSFPQAGVTLLSSQHFHSSTSLIPPKLVPLILNIFLHIYSWCHVKPGFNHGINHETPLSSFFHFKIHPSFKKKTESLHDSFLDCCNLQLFLSSSYNSPINLLNSHIKLLLFCLPCKYLFPLIPVQLFYVVF